MVSEVSLATDVRYGVYRITFQTISRKKQTSNLRNSLTNGLVQTVDIIYTRLVYQ